jgi:hypothetical protein
LEEVRLTLLTTEYLPQTGPLEKYIERHTVQHAIGNVQMCHIQPELHYTNRSTMA